MERTSFENWNCSVARTLEVIGDWWTMMIVREAFYGTRTFSDFERRLGISKSTLSRRLSKMEEDGLLERHASKDDARSFEYRLTDKGRDLFTVLVAMTQWGDRWQDRNEGPPVVLLRQRTNIGLAAIKVKDANGQEVEPKDIYPAPGTGADRLTRARFSANEHLKSS